MEHSAEVCEDKSTQTKSAPVAIGMSVADAAALFRVSRRSVTRAKVVLAKGIPVLRRLVMAGQVAISAAADVANLPKEEQEQIVEGGPDAVIAASRGTRQHHKSTTQKPERLEAVASVDPEGLLPCKHCGSPAEYESAFDILRGNLQYAICTNEACGIQTPLRKSRDEVRAVWNLRSK